MSLAQLALSELGEGEFDRRRVEARRSGNPAWLWPEVHAKDWAAAVAQISKAIATILSGKPGRLPDCDPSALSLAGYTSGTGPLLGWWLETGMLSAPPEICDVLACHLRHGRERSARTRARASAVTARLARRSIPVVILKGGHTAFVYFPDPATRPSADLDLLVPAASATLAKATLRAAGFRCVEWSRGESSWGLEGESREPRSLWLAHADDPWSVDLHCSLDFSAGPGARTLRLDQADPFASDDRWPVESRAKVLRQPLLSLYLAAHAGGGLHSLTLLRMVELILVIRRDRKQDRLDWKQFLEIGQSAGGLGSAYPALAMCDKLAFGTVPQPVLLRCREAAPQRVRRIVDRLDANTAQRVDRSSVAEHFMWVSGFSGWARQLRSDLFPERSIRSIYEMRAYRLIRGTISR